MLIRSRSARFAALALAATTPLVASYAAPAFADGSDADVTATINEDGDVEVTSTKGLSRTTVVLCDGSVVVVPFWSGDPTSGVVDVDGVVRVVFVHSGDNTTTEAEVRLRELAGADAVSGSSTGEIAYDNDEACDGPGDDGDGGDDGDDGDGDGDDDGAGRDDNGDPNDGDDDTTVSPTDISDPGPVTTTGGPSTDPAPSTAVLGVTLEKASNPAPAPAASPVVDSSTLSAGGELPRTGAGNMQFLVTLAVSLLAAGAALRAAFGRRIRSASSPG